MVGQILVVHVRADVQSLRNTLQQRNGRDATQCIALVHNGGPPRLLHPLQDFIRGVQVCNNIMSGIIEVATVVTTNDGR